MNRSPDTHRFFRAQEGVAYIELAICLPLMLLVFLGGIEVTRLLLAIQKVEKTAATISDVVAQADTISYGDLDNIVTAAGQVMKPYDFTDNGYVIISSVTQNGSPSKDNPPVISWQYKGGGAWVQSSQIGSRGGPANLPSGLTLNARDNVIVAEIFFNYHPLIVSNTMIPISTIYRIAIFKPRLGALTTLSYLAAPNAWRKLL